MNHTGRTRPTEELVDPHDARGSRSLRERRDWTQSPSRSWRLLADRHDSSMLLARLDNAGKPYKLPSVSLEGIQGHLVGKIGGLDRLVLVVAAGGVVQ
ncbi:MULTISPECIES: hypothetical protein [Bradyrhizobium]|uniref:hypothetical protein n=1 Tax=Bradyrhizobium TaxID=374 RepID=UPI0030F4942E